MHQPILWRMVYIMLFDTYADWFELIHMRREVAGALYLVRLTLQNKVVHILVVLLLQLTTNITYTSLLATNYSLVMRAAANKPNVNIVAVNDPFISVDYSKYI